MALKADKAKYRRDDMTGHTAYSALKQAQRYMKAAQDIARIEKSFWHQTAAAEVYAARASDFIDMSIRLRTAQ